MKKVSDLQVGTALQASEMPLPAELQEALGELVGAAREGLLALSVGAGLSLVSRLMELEVERLAGPKGSQNPDRVAKRHGYEQGSVTLGGRRVTIRRPRVRSADDSQELPLATYEYFASRDPLTHPVLQVPSAQHPRPRARPREAAISWPHLYGSGRVRRQRRRPRRDCFGSKEPYVAWLARPVGSSPIPGSRRSG